MGRQFYMTNVDKLLELSVRGIDLSMSLLPHSAFKCYLP
jgi:hypothetical protein